MTEVVIGSRASDLAMWQAEHVAALLRAAHPALTVRIEKVSSKGDRVRDVPLAKIGGKGLFTKELEVALLDHEIDLAVHSLKDLPTELPQGLCLACVPERENPWDALVSRNGETLANLPRGARVGTSSLRRQAMLRATRPDLNILDIRGNVPTRLKKLRDGEYDAIVLAMAGLTRLGLGGEVTETLGASVMLPAVGQGALGIEVREDDAALRQLLAPLNDSDTWNAVAAERALLSGLGGGCQTPLGAWARVEKGVLTLDASVCTMDGTRKLDTTQSGGVKDAIALGQTAARVLLAAGAGECLASLDKNFEARGDALAGRRIVVTRPREQAGRLAEALEAHGAEVMTFPTIAIQGLPVDPELLSEDYDWIIFTSVNGVRHFVEGVTTAERAVADLRTAAVCVIGPATADAARDAGFVVSLTPPEYVAESVLEVIRATEGDLTGKRILMPRGKLARVDLPRGLREEGATVVEAVVYDTVPVCPGADAVEDLLNAKPDMVTFTSGSTVDNFVAAVGLEGVARLKDTSYAAIGPITEGAAVRHGLKISVSPTDYDIPSLVRAVAAFYGA